MIGILTALPKEYVAVEVLLEHPRPHPVSGAGVGRQYTLGEIPAANGSRHQVVLALLPSMGTGLAATQATRLLEHFPHLRALLMLGISGGVPAPDRPDEHVRLGDIVVSDQYGVIQYDFVKKTMGDTLYRPLPRPPSADLLLAARLLEAGQMKGERPWQAWITQALRRLHLTRPSKETDVLISTTNPTQIIAHPRDRKRSAGVPRVFLGPIASANTLLKDARLRDELRDHFHVKAIEMEAAGVADSTWDFGVSYLVIRGICDYCDANKADTWQEYAAVAAAGYACALLQSLPAIQASRDGSTLPNSGAASVPLHKSSSAVAPRLSIGKHQGMKRVPLHKSSSAVAPFPKVWNVPSRSHPLFADNKELLRVIHERFIGATAQAIIQPQGLSGPGGIGKTRFATEYAFRYRGDYDAILWVNAASRDVLLTDYLALAHELQLPEGNTRDQPQMQVAVTRWLTEHERWLLILDNADDLKVVQEFLPRTGRGHVLLTTRSHPLHQLADRVEIATMTPEEGALFLLRRATLLERQALLDDASAEERRDAIAITQQMGGLPLALDQVGAYIEETGCGVSGYLEVYQTHARELLNERGEIVTDHPDPVATTWVLAFERMESNPSAAELLRLCAFLAPDAIPEEIVLEGVAAVRRLQEQTPLVASAYHLNAAAREFLKSSLIQRDDKAKTLTIHRLVQAALKNWISLESHQHWAELAVRAVAHVFPERGNLSWQRCQRYLAQVFACQELVQEYCLSCIEVAHLFDRAGGYLHLRAQYEQAEALYQQALAVYGHYEDTHGLDLATTLEQYATLLRSTGREREARQSEQRAREVRGV